MNDTESSSASRKRKQHYALSNDTSSDPNKMLSTNTLQSSSSKRIFTSDGFNRNTSSPDCLHTPTNMNQNNATRTPRSSSRTPLSNLTNGNIS